MGFRFRLQSVLDHRAHLEEVALHEFAKHLKTQQECERHILWLEAEHKRALEKLSQRELDGIPALEYQMENEYATVLRLQALRERSRLPMLNSQTEAARRVLMEARRNRMVLDTLKERHYERWQREQLLAEQKVIDEAAVGAFVRRDIS